jgi:hypothetical protein
VLPATDSLIAFKPVWLAVYSAACLDVTDVQAIPRRFHVPHVFGPQRQLVDVRCDGATAVAVEVRYSGVVVPELSAPNQPHPTWNLTRIGLRHRIVVRQAVPAEYGRVIAQRPAPGSVVPFGTTITLVIGR